jgi:SAM-dependent methyltransferase
VEAGAYDAWYQTPRGAWIGEAEFRLLCRLLRPAYGESPLDLGCGTGYFTRRFAGETGLCAVGLDPNASWLEFARASSTGSERYCLGTAVSLPFADSSFDLAVSGTALCFIDDGRGAVLEILRVTRKRFAIGLLNRHSLLYLQKGRAGGSGAYRGAHWHTAPEIRALFRGLPVVNLNVRSTVFFADGGRIAHSAERLISHRLLLGAFVVVACDVGRQRHDAGE